MEYIEEDEEEWETYPEDLLDGDLFPEYDEEKEEWELEEEEW